MRGTLSIDLGLVVFMSLVASSGVGCAGRSPRNAGAPADSGIAHGGVCASSCDNACATDQDCNTGVGELCCDFGERGKICQSAKACPKLCTGNSACQAPGQSCVQTTLASAQLTCEPASTGLTFCQTNADCGTTGAVCCGDYSKTFCVPGTRCPTACTTTSDCDAVSGQICCTSAKIAEPSLKVAGLCLDPKLEACPLACATSADCSATGQLCCNGLCADVCPKACAANADCGAQICCATTDVKIPPPPRTFRTSMECGGTPNPGTCLLCGATTGVACTRCLGCSVQANLAGCKGTPTYATCAECDASLGCSSCPGCQIQMACNGVPAPCNGFAAQDGCIQHGCSWDPASATCSGTVSSCSGFFTETRCSTEVGCTWSLGCTGTPPPCSSFDATDSTTCLKETGCTWVSPQQACAGTVTPCEQIPPSFCTSQMGCSLH
jgi:hypothetical protein